MSAHHPVMVAASLDCVFLMWRLTRCYALYCVCPPCISNRKTSIRFASVVSQLTTYLSSVVSSKPPGQVYDMLRWTSPAVQWKQRPQEIVRLSCLVHRMISFLSMQITVTIASSISFHANPNLRSLEISMFCINPSTPCSTSWLQAIITTVASHSFEEITLWFITVLENEWLERFDFQSLERSLLQRVDPFASPILHTKFVQTGARTDNDGLVAAIEMQLPELHKRGLLVVCPSEALDGWWMYVW